MRIRTFGLAALMAPILVGLASPAEAATNPAACARIKQLRSGPTALEIRSAAWDDLFEPDGRATPREGAPCFEVLHVDSVLVDGQCLHAPFHAGRWADGWTTENVSKTLWFPRAVDNDATSVQVQFFNDDKCVNPLGDEVTFPRVRDRYRADIYALRAPVPV